jgi:hypothetical protein
MKQAQLATQKQDPALSEQIEALAKKVSAYQQLPAAALSDDAPAPKLIQLGKKKTKAGDVAHLGADAE